MEVNPNLTIKAQKDYLLVQKAMGGDQKAYGALMDNYRDTLYFTLLKMTNNDLDAEDLTIEAFGKAFKNLHQYSPDYAFSTWLFRIATNNCIDFIRRNRINNLSYHAGNQHSENAIPYEIPSQSMDPETFFIHKQKIKLVRELVKKLKPHYRQLIELRYFKEYSYEEIATEFNLPLGTVKAQLFRARELLYQILEKSPDKI